jgi:Cdc6-like AAA superfamily ATPase
MNVFHKTVASLAPLFRRLKRGVSARDLSGCPGGDGTILPGRERLIQRILCTIHNNSILLLGDQGIGKTSVLLELRDRLREVENSTYAFFPVYIDLHHVPEGLLFAAVGDAILRQLSQTSPPRRVNGAASHRENYDHRDLANEVRGVIRALSQNNPKSIRLILLVDGIDEVNTYAPRTAQRVRSLFMAGFSENLVMVATAVEIDKRWEQEGSPWYNFFEEINLHRIEGDVESRSDVRDTMARDE